MYEPQRIDKAMIHAGTLAGFKAIFAREGKCYITRSGDGEVYEEVPRAEAVRFSREVIDEEHRASRCYCAAVTPDGSCDWIRDRQ
jgi:hypothetical protein